MYIDNIQKEPIGFMSTWKVGVSGTLLGIINKQHINDYGNKCRMTNIFSDWQIFAHLSYWGEKLSLIGTLPLHLALLRYLKS